MHTTLKVSTYLTWINMIVWGFIAAVFILGSLFTQNLSLLIVTFLTGVTVLHSYAAFQLHKSVRDPLIPLSGQTPVGIRFIGFIALFFGVLYIGDGIALLRNMRQSIEMMRPQIPPQYKNIDLAAYARGISIFAIFTGACIVANVILNFRMLRWYIVKGHGE